jgi:hypothetical protein
VSLRPDRAAALLGGLVLVPACGSHIEGTKVCRRYPTAFIEAGRPYTCELVVVTSSVVSTEYRYDASSRIVERHRRRSDIGGARDLDVTAYTSWDALGRPISGTVSSSSGSGPITIRYDDAARRMDASNGESVTVDANGNMVREVVVYGLGPPGDGLERQIQTTAETCL